MGATASILTINPSANPVYGYKFRCRITNNDVVKYGPEYTIRFGSTWTSGINSAWENPGNWNCNVLPDQHTDVIIEPGTSNFPVIGNNFTATCRSLRIKKGATVKVNTGGKLNIKGPPAQ